MSENLPYLDSYPCIVWQSQKQAGGERERICINRNGEPMVEVMPKKDAMGQDSWVEATGDDLARILLKWVESEIVR